MKIVEIWILEYVVHDDDWARTELKTFETYEEAEKFVRNRFSEWIDPGGEPPRFETVITDEGYKKIISYDVDGIPWHIIHKSSIRVS